LGEEKEISKSLNVELKDRTGQIKSLNMVNDDLEKTMREINVEKDHLENAKKAIERKFESNKKILNEKIKSLNDIIIGETETREMWVERYNKEAHEHKTTNAILMNLKGENRDAILKMQQSI